MNIRATTHEKYPSLKILVNQRLEPVAVAFPGASQKWYAHGISKKELATADTLPDLVRAVCALDDADELPVIEL